MLAGAILPIVQPFPGRDDDFYGIYFCFVKYGSLSFMVEETTSLVFLHFFTHCDCIKSLCTTGTNLNNSKQDSLQPNKIELQQSFDRIFHHIAS